MTILVFLLLVYSSSCSTIWMLFAAAKDVDVFILAGQSNMVGYGGVENYTWDGVVPRECQPDPRILRLGQDMKWEDAHEPLHKLTNTTGGVFGIGPGMPFANSLLKRDPAIGSIGLVPCAVGGTPIREWSRDSSNYKNMIARAHAAVDGSVLRAFLWYQGEYDSSNLTDAMAYESRLTAFFLNVRADLHSPTLPIIEVALASGSVYTQEIREAQLRTQHLLNVKCVDAKGLPLNPEDNLHLTTPAQIQLGSMLADAYLKLAAPALVSGGDGAGLPNFAYLPFSTCICLFVYFYVLQLV